MSEAESLQNPDTINQPTEEQTIVKCVGCEFHAAGQRDHMWCPDGCLHDKISCSTCNNRSLLTIN